MVMLSGAGDNAALHLSYLMGSAQQGVVCSSGGLAS